MKVRVAAEQPFDVTESSAAEITTRFVSIRRTAGVNVVDREADRGRPSGW
jgi:hypothetical protein